MRVNHGVEPIKSPAGVARGGSRPKPPKPVAQRANLEAPRATPDHEKSKRRLTDKTVALARELFAIQAKDLMQLQAQISELNAKLMTWHRADECSRRLAKIPSVGPIGAVLRKMKTPDPQLFRSGRQFAAWIGLTPKDHSTAGKVKLGGITRAGDEGLRSVLVAGATAVIQHAQRGGKPSPWLTGVLKRKSPKLAAVALANKTARIAWKMMVTGETYTAKSAPTQAGAV
jgi:transposase